jgi:LPXTG-motif cell wall-anchored protein
MVMASDVAGNITSTYDSETGEIFSFVLKEKMSPVMIIIIILIILVLIALLAIVIIKRKKKDKE